MALSVLQTSKEFWVFLLRQTSSRTSLESHVYLHEFKKSWFVIRDWWISIRFVCFVFQGSLLCDRPVPDNNRPVKFARRIFLIFLVLVSCKNKPTAASFHRQKIRWPSWFPSLFLSSRRVILSQAGRARYIVICVNPAFTKMIDGTEKPKIPSKFVIRAARYNEFSCNESLTRKRTERKHFTKKTSVTNQLEVVSLKRNVVATLRNVLFFIENTF